MTGRINNCSAVEEQSEETHRAASNLARMGSDLQQLVGRFTG